MHWHVKPRGAEDIMKKQQKQTCPAFVSDRVWQASFHGHGAVERAKARIKK